MDNRKSRFRTLSTSSSEDDDEDQDYEEVEVKRSKTSLISSDSSDEDEEDVEEEFHVKVEDCCCPICLNDFTNQRIGVPNECNHLFCVDCILEWSKNANSCPVDRTEFTRIRVYQRNGGLFINEIVIEGKPCEKVELLEIDCQVCHQGDNEDILLLCDGCDGGYHCTCLNPPLAEVPTNEWFCDNCRESMTPSRPPRQRQTRMVGRTMASERVRSEITRSRLQRARIVSNLDEQLDEIFNDIITNAQTRMRITASVSRRISRPRRKKRRTTKRSKSRRSKSTKRKKKRSTSRKASKKCVSSTIKKGGNNSFLINEETSSQSLSLFGGADDLDEYLAADDVQEHDPSYMIAQKHRVLSQSAIRFNVPLPSLFATGNIGNERNIAAPAPATTTPFLLDNILSGQKLLLAPSKNLSIKQGKLSLNIKRKPGCSSKKDEKKTTEEPKINKAALSPKNDQSGASTTRRSSDRNSKSSNNKNKSSSSTRSSKKSHSNSNDNSNSSVNGQNMDNSNPDNASENISNSVKPDKNANKDGKKPLKSKNANPVGKPRKILIRPVFNLPKNEGSKNESNVYDPFEAISDDIMPEIEEEGLYDPFQPTVSDEEVTSPIKSPEKSPEPVENFGKFSFNRESQNSIEKSDKAESHNSIPKESTDNSQINLECDNFLKQDLVVKKDSKKIKSEKNKNDNETLSAQKQTKVKEEEFDMFADEVSKTEEPATEDVKVIANTESEAQIKLPDFLPEPKQEDTTVKFRKVFQKPKDNFSEKENDNNLENASSDDEYQPPLKPVQIIPLTRKISNSKEGDLKSSRREKRRNRSSSVDNKEEQAAKKIPNRARRSRSRSRRRSTRNEKRSPSKSKRRSRSRKRSGSRSRKVYGGRVRRRSRSRSRRRSRKSRSGSRSRRQSERSKRRSRSRSRKKSSEKSPTKQRSRDRQNKSHEKTPVSKEKSPQLKPKKKSKEKSSSNEPVNSPPENETPTKLENIEHSSADENKHFKIDEIQNETFSQVFNEDNLSKDKMSPKQEEIKNKLSKRKKSKKHKIDKEKQHCEEDMKSLAPEDISFTEQDPIEEFLHLDRGEVLKPKKSKKHGLDKEKGNQPQDQNFTEFDPVTEFLHLEKDEVLKTKKSKKHKHDKEKQHHEDDIEPLQQEDQNLTKIDPVEEFSHFEKDEIKPKKSKKEKHHKKENKDKQTSADYKFDFEEIQQSPVHKKSRRDKEKNENFPEKCAQHQSNSSFELNLTQEFASNEESTDNLHAKRSKKPKKDKCLKETKPETADHLTLIDSPKKKKKKHKKERESEGFSDNQNKSLLDSEKAADSFTAHTKTNKDDNNLKVFERKSEKKAKKKKKHHAPELSDSEFNQTLEIPTANKSSKKIKHKKHKHSESDKLNYSEKHSFSKHENNDIYSINEKTFNEQEIEFLQKSDLTPKKLKPDISDEAYADMLLDDLTAIKEVPKPRKHSFQIDEWSKDLTLDPADIKMHKRPQPDPEIDIDDLLEASLKKSSDTTVSSAEKTKHESIAKKTSFVESFPEKIAKSPSPYSPTQIEFESPSNSSNEDQIMSSDNQTDSKQPPQNKSQHKLSDIEMPLISDFQRTSDDNKNIIKIVEDPNISCIEDIFADSPKVDYPDAPKSVSPVKENTETPIKSFSMTMGKAPVITKNSLFSDSSPTHTLPPLEPVPLSTATEKTSGQKLKNREEIKEPDQPKLSSLEGDGKGKNLIEKDVEKDELNEMTEIKENVELNIIEKSSEENSPVKEIHVKHKKESSQNLKHSKNESKRSRHRSTSSSPAKRRSRKDSSTRKQRSRSRKREKDKHRSSSRSRRSSHYKDDSSKRRRRSRSPDHKSNKRSRSPRRRRRSRTPDRRRDDRRGRHRSSRSPKSHQKNNSNVVTISHKSNSSGDNRMSPQPIATISSISTIGHTFNRDRHISMNELMPETQLEELQTHVNSNSALIQIPTLDHSNIKQLSAKKPSNITLTESDNNTAVQIEEAKTSEISKTVKQPNETSSSNVEKSEDVTSSADVKILEDINKSPPPPSPPPKKTDPRMESTSATAQNFGLTLKALTGLSALTKEKEESVLNPTQILNIVGLNPTQQSAAKDAIMNIAELSKKLQLGQFLAGGNLENPIVSKMKEKEEEDLSPLSINDVEGSAVEMYNKDKVKQLQKKKTFQEQVVEEAKNAIKPHYERREINKTQYKDIMKRAVNKICQTDRTMEVNAVKIRRLIRRYVECYQEKNEKHKEKMRSALDKKVDKHVRSKKLEAPPMSPPSPLGSPLIAGEYEDNTGGLILKKEPRKIVTLPDLPLPPPPPPPKPRYMVMK